MGSEAGEAAFDACDWTACNGFTLKINIFEKDETYGQCQHPAGNNWSEDDFFCFVNADSNCKDKVIVVICHHSSISSAEKNLRIIAERLT